LLAVAVAHAESNLEPKLATEMISQGSGSAFDPDAVRIFLRTAPKMVVPGKQRVVPLADLRPGMVLAEGIYSENGMLLIPDGQRLTATYIDKLLNFNRINPIAQTLLVLLLSEEVGATGPFLVLVSDQAKPCFMDQRGGLQGMACGLTSHFGSSQLA
jgi:hypothetical protein